eukprot:jgi/Picre1/30908/NNA_006267.t1
MSNGVRVHGGGGKSGQWAFLRHRGYDVNPCKSQLHPSVTLEGIEPESGEELCVQEAYTPESVCFGCGPSAKDGLKLRSFRRINGMEASVTLDEKYCAFPGIINGGIISALFDCHGNWTAAMTLMDRGCLPKPPLTLTYEMLITYEEPTPRTRSSLSDLEFWRSRKAILWDPKPPCTLNSNFCKRQAHPLLGTVVGRVGRNSWRQEVEYSRN